LDKKGGEVRFSSTRFTLTGADAAVESSQEGTVRRAGERKTLYIVMRRICSRSTAKACDVDNYMAWNFEH
jgi:hypothetical protein